MKGLMLGFVVGTLLFVGAQEDAAKKERAKLQGTWKVESVEAPQGEVEELRDAEVVFKADGNLELRKANETKKAAYTLDPSAKPKQIDVMPEEDGTKLQGIYQLEKDQLQMAFGANPDAPRPTEFKASGQAILIKLKRGK